MAVKVSVVIPVYNPGEYVEDCIASLLRQSLPDVEYEAIFVNDGSTDATPARLDALAAEYPHMHVIHQEASGWSGKPRNAGIAAAQGEFVMFVDNDDWLGDEALERMYEYGVANKADVIVGKMAGKGRPVPLELFRENRPHATVDNAPLIDSLTPHKMFRKEFLDRNNLRFMEGRRRLEDHVFVAEAYLLASNVSVLSDYLCYYHIKREDASNAGFQRFDPVGYFKNLREALDVVERHTEPGPLRDKLYRRWLRNEMVERLRGRRLLNVDEDFRRELFAEIHSVVTERFGPGVAAGMNPQQQAVAALVVADRLADVEELARFEAQVRPTGRLKGLEWDGGVLRIAFTAEYQAGEAEDAAPLTFRSDEDGKDRLEALTALGIDIPVSLKSARVDLVVRERPTAAEFFQPVDCTPERQTADDGSFRLVLRAEASVDPLTAAKGVPLGDGIWDVVIRITASGWTKETRLGSVRGEAAESARRGTLGGEPRRLVLPYWTEGPGNLSLDVDHSTSKFDRDVREITPQDVTLDGGRITLPIRLEVAETEAVKVRFKSPLDGKAVEADATLAPGGNSAELSAALPAEGLAGRQVRIELGLPSAKRGEPRWTVLPVALDVAADGTAALTTTEAVNAAAKEAKAAAAAAAKAAKAEAARKAARKKRSLLRRVAGRVKRTLTK
ncbi:glycosyltransferase family 2 protein [Streptomyces sp. NBC_01465]|uniref:glycosyltransferase family 2 protein n=1 Tax=Streptomyces sp. NBC_01465 TaxID=2903878 RepID=UPI002E362151|nr:glycosyltransferase [Streptomyces sp. NBC_01465]